MRTLKVSLFATVVGTGAWALGLTAKIWPAHPFWAAFFIAIGAEILAYYIWPKPQK